MTSFIVHGKLIFFFGGGGGGGVIRLVAGLGLVPGYWPLRDGNVPTLMAATVEPLLTNSGRKLIPPFQLDLVHVDCGLLCKLTQWGPTPKWTHLVEQSVAQPPLGSPGYQDHHWPRPRIWGVT